MKENKELECEDIRIEDEFLVDDDNKNVINVYLGTYFDVDAKFSLNTAARDDEWLNMYAHYNTADDTLIIECVLSNDDEEKSFVYTPTKSETKLIKGMIFEESQRRYGQTPQEYCEDAASEDMALLIGGIGQ